jgi:hypothetical protein
MEENANEEENGSEGDSIKEPIRTTEKIKRLAKIT